jgi:ribosome-associated toxin RatA of RatAB toxin-antitoxin module
MPNVVKSVLVMHSASAMFDLVDDVEQYPAFLPWCGGATVLSRDERVTEAAIIIQYRGVRQQFSTRNAKVRPTEMTLSLLEGPFKSLYGAWRFTALSEAACKVEFELDYQFGNKVIESLLGSVMSMVAETFVDRFVTRADTLAAKSISVGNQK